MTLTFQDRAPIEKVRRLADGRIAATAKFAKGGGVQVYTGAEVGRPELTSVTVYRPEEEVFDHAAMASFAHKAITVGHPADAVTADNWKQHSAGWTEGKVARNGDYVEIPLMLADASAVRAYNSGVNQLSAGYTCELVWGDGIAPSGEKYSAKQVQIRGNHIAIVAAGRAGSEARIGDGADIEAQALAKSIDALNSWRTVHDSDGHSRAFSAPAADAKAVTEDAAYQNSIAKLNSWRG